MAFVTSLPLLRQAPPVACTTHNARTPRMHATSPSRTASILAACSAAALISVSAAGAFGLPSLPDNVPSIPKLPNLLGESDTESPSKSPAKNKDQQMSAEESSAADDLLSRLEKKRASK